MGARAAGFCSGGSCLCSGEYIGTYCDVKCTCSGVYTGELCGTACGSNSATCAWHLGNLGASCDATYADLACTDGDWG